MNNRIDLLSQSRSSSARAASAALCFGLALFAVPTPVAAQGTTSCTQHSGGEFYFPDLPADGLGYTYDIDETTGRPVRMRRLFNDAPSLIPTVFDSRLTFKSSVADSSSFQAQGGSLSAGTSIGLVEMALSAGYAVAESESSTAAGFSLGYERCYPRVAFSPLPGSPNSVQSWDPQALQILSIPNATTRTQQWREAGFGRYVAFGTDLRASLEAKVGLVESTSWSSRSAFFSLMTEYQGLWVSGSAEGSIAALLYAAQSQSGLSVTMYGVGVEPPPNMIPLPSEIDTLAEQTQWVNGTLLSAFAGNPSKQVGLYLKPAQSFVPPGVWGGPNLTSHAWDETLCGASALAARDAVLELHQLAKWEHPASLVSFLDRHTMPDPQGEFLGAGYSYAAAMNVVKFETVGALQNLRDALLDYAQLGHSSQASYQAALEQARLALIQATLRVSYVRERLANIHVDPAIPPMRVNVTDLVGFHGNCGAYLWRACRIRIEDGAFFTDGSISALETRLARQAWNGVPATIRAWVEEPPYTQPTYLTNLDRHRLLRTPQVTTSGPGAGLTRVDVHMRIQASGCSDQARIMVTDDLGRQAQHTSFGTGFP